jgi:outer membrane lipoprotein carrier protein
MIIKIVFAIVFFSLLLPLSGALAQDTPDFYKAFSCAEIENSGVKNTILHTVQESYHNVKGLEADFFQSSSLLGMEERVVSEGSLKFLKPGMMDWQYTEPTPQRFVTDGKEVWYYEPGVNQVTVGSLSGTFSSDIPVSFLLGIGDLSKSFEVENVCKNEQGILIALLPGEDEQSLKTFYLLVDKDSYLPIGAKLIDVGDTSTEFLFQKSKTEVSLSEDDFKFSPPAGVDIVYN